MDLAVDRTISIMDTMQCVDQPEEYFVAGRSALFAIQECLRAAGFNNAPNSILDLPSGHGRVLRWLKVAYPQASIVACDTDRDAVDFCRKQFGVEGVYSEVDPRCIPISDKFELIWVGSLLTHLSRYLWDTWLTWFREHLTDNGILVLSTNGITAARFIRHKYSFWIQDLPNEGVQLHEDYAAAGFGYVDYQTKAGYGLSLSQPSIVMGILESCAMQPVFFRVNAFHGCQDVFGAMKSDSSNL
ncbi:MAG: class I SAM-dependent methyltransferase [Deltaproteobacteria bacterium]